MAERPAAGEPPEDAAMRAAPEPGREERPKVPETEAAAEGSAWSFVQMNMHLLPIARPRPVSVAAHRLPEGAVLAGCKPRTPNQRLHERVRHSGSNISPRRPVGAMSVVIPPARDRSGEPASWHHRSRTGSEDWSVRPPRPVPPELRMRSWSDDVPACTENGSPPSKPVRPWTPYVPRRRASVTLSDYGDGAPKGQFKGKRILELQDEERRLLPGDTATAPSPTKRSRRQL